MNLEIFEELLKETASQYDFETIKHGLDKIEIHKRKKPICFLRHDIDFSPQNALRMAQLEQKYGANSTYTVLLSGQYYNPFEKNIREILKKIKGCGHEIGLHFDPTVYNINEELSLNNYIEQEASALANLLETPISMFSFHNTTDFSMSCRAYQYGGLVNAYSNFFHNEVEYTSDSNGYWRFRSWKDLLLEKHKVIQILTHPIWWQPENNYPPFETVIKNITERADLCLSIYTELFRGQNLRINHSLLNETLLKNEKVNDPDILNLYAENSDLLECLRRGSIEKLATKLDEISKRLNLE